MTIRPFEPTDLPRLREIVVEAFEGVSIDQAIEQHFGQINNHDWRWRKARHIDEDVERAADGVYVAVDDAGAILGFATTRCDPEAGIGSIPNVCVAAGQRGRGIGRQLVQFALEQFRGRGLTHARIETLVQNDVGNGLYTSLGFREVARQIHFAMDLNTLTEPDS